VWSVMTRIVYVASINFLLKSILPYISSTFIPIEDRSLQ